MDVTKSRYGKDRSIEKLGNNKIRVMGESTFTRSSMDKDEVCTMFDFEGGPCYNVGGTIRYQKSQWKIVKIIPEEAKHKELASVILEVKY
jgi:hypothetical protein